MVCRLIQAILIYAAHSSGFTACQHNACYRRIRFTDIASFIVGLTLLTCLFKSKEHYYEM